jgi:hypothetical protein
LREALSQPELAARLPRFAELRERRLRRLRQQRALSLLTLAAVALLGLRFISQDEQLPVIRAELAAHSDAKRPAATAAVPSAQLSPAPLVVPTTSAATPSTATALLETKVKPRARTRATRQPALAQAPRLPEQPNGGAKACAQLARDGAAQRALECYRELGSGTGMIAELALFEQARVEGKLLRQPQRALLTLEGYRRRFPHGSLRGEVMLAQIDWLLATGDDARARELVDDALASGLLHERSAELERLRARLGATDD